VQTQVDLRCCRRWCVVECHVATLDGCLMSHARWFLLVVAVGCETVPGTGEIARFPAETLAVGCVL
jgi:hypothetical protein